MKVSHSSQCGTDSASGADGIPLSPSVRRMVRLGRAIMDRRFPLSRSVAFARGAGGILARFFAPGPPLPPSRCPEEKRVGISPACFFSGESEPGMSAGYGSKTYALCLAAVARAAFQPQSLERLVSRSRSTGSIGSFPGSPLGSSYGGCRAALRERGSLLSKGSRPVPR